MNEETHRCTVCAQLLKTEEIPENTQRFDEAGRNITDWLCKNCRWESGLERPEGSMPSEER